MIGIEEFDERKILTEKVKDFVKTENPSKFNYLYLSNGKFVYIDDYRNTEDAYAYISISWTSYKSDFFYPFLYTYYSTFLFSYLSKLGFYYDNHAIVPASTLKYLVDVERYEEYMSIHVVDIDEAIERSQLRNIVFEVLADADKIGKTERKLTKAEIDKIHDKIFTTLKIAGHNIIEAGNIVSGYYDDNDHSLAKEVARIVMEYYRIFSPYSICYESWKEVDCSSINLS